MAGLALMFGGPKGGKGDMPAKEEDSGEGMSGKSAAAKAVMSAFKSGDSGELERGLTAFVEACAADKGEEY
jgi:hypothetical protein